jgi:RNA polymerase sigma factor for flagellar operon FliA
MISQHLRLVSYVVGKMAIEKGAGPIDREEAIAFGVEGLIQAVDHFDPDRGAAFTTYAVQRIRGSILDAIRRMDMLPRSLRKSIRDVERANLDLSSLYGRWPTAKEIAMRLSLPIEDVVEIMGHAGSHLVSLDELKTNDAFEDSTPWEAADEHEFSDPAEAVDHKALLELMDLALSSLPQRDQQVIEMRYKRGLSFRDIGDFLGLSESRVCQLHRRILEQLRERLGRTAYAAA